MLTRINDDLYIEIDSITSIWSETRGERKVWVVSIIGGINHTLDEQEAQIILRNYVYP